MGFGDVSLPAQHPYLRRMKPPYGATNPTDRQVIMALQFRSSANGRSSETVWLDRAARFFFGVPLVVSGVMHFVGAETLDPLVPIPPARFWVYVTGVALFGAGVAIVAGRRVVLAAATAGVLMLLFAYTVHLPMLITGHPEALGGFRNDQMAFGGALAILLIHRKARQDIAPSAQESP